MPEIVTHIILTGICLFVRPDAMKPPEAALFMDGRTDLQGKPVTPEHEHHVYLAVNTDEYTLDLYTQQDQTPLHYEDMVGTMGAHFRVVTLDDTSIEVASVVSEGEVTADLTDVPSLREAWPKMVGGAHKEAKELHQHHGQVPLKGRLNARLELVYGNLKARQTNADVWVFDPDVRFHTPRTGTISQEVDFYAHVQGDSLRLAIRAAGNGALRSIVTITPIDASATKLEVLLANVPKKDLFPNNSCKTIDCKVEKQNICCADHHFALYYKAFNKPPSAPPIPHKQPDAIVPGPFGLHRVGGADCGPAQVP